MQGLNYSQFRAADNSYLNPIREMKADQARREGTPPEVAPPEALNLVQMARQWGPFGLVGLLILFALLANMRRQAAPASRDPATVPPPPEKSTAAWSLDLLLWGGLAIILIASFGRVDMPNLGSLFTNTENMRNYGRDFLSPDFSNWQLLVGQMWLTVQIALWGTFLAVFIAVPLSLMASRNLSRHQTAFTLSIEAREGVTTGISAAEIDGSHSTVLFVGDNNMIVELLNPNRVRREACLADESRVLASDLRIVSGIPQRL